MALRLATGPVTWGVDFADAAGNPRWEDVLDGIARSGLGALELGPVGYLPEEPALLREALASRGLAAVGSFVFEALHDPAQADGILATAGRACRAIAAAGGAVLVIIDRPRSERAATAGRYDAAPRLDDRGWDAMIGLVERVAASAREHGLRPAFHPHAGSYVEFGDEIDRLMADTTLDLCLDTGHAAYAGLRPQELVERHGARIAHLHLKDVDGTVLDRARRAPLDFWTAIAAGIFCPLGEGVVDLAAVLAALEAWRYGGYATIEQDRVAGRGDPLDDLARSLAVIARLGAAGAA